MPRLGKIGAGAFSMLFALSAVPARAAEAPGARKIPLVVITDLYHPHQDVGDNLDLITGFALPNVDLRAVCLDFIGRMEPRLRRYMGYALARSVRADFLRAMDEDDPAVQPALYRRAHNVWETSPWMAVAGLKLVRRADSRCRIAPEAEVKPGDTVLPNDLKPCRVKVEPDGRFQFEFVTGPSNFSLIDRGDPKENEAALREALPEFYLGFRP
jgi:hypothetical protein